VKEEAEKSLKKTQDHLREVQKRSFVIANSSNVEEYKSQMREEGRRSSLEVEPSNGVVKTKDNVHDWEEIKNPKNPKIIYYYSPSLNKTRWDKPDYMERQKREFYTPQTFREVNDDSEKKSYEERSNELIERLKEKRRKRIDGKNNQDDNAFSTTSLDRMETFRPPPVQTTSSSNGQKSNKPYNPPPNSFPKSLHHLPLQNAMSLSDGSTRGRGRRKRSTSAPHGGSRRGRTSNQEEEGEKSRGGGRKRRGSRGNRRRRRRGRSSEPRASSNLDSIAEEEARKKSEYQEDYDKKMDKAIRLARMKRKILQRKKRDQEMKSAYVDSLIHVEEPTSIEKPKKEVRKKKEDEISDVRSEEKVIVDDRNLITRNVNTANPQNELLNSVEEPPDQMMVAVGDEKSLEEVPPDKEISDSPSKKKKKKKKKVKKKRKVKKVKKIEEEEGSMGSDSILLGGGGNETSFSSSSNYPEDSEEMINPNQSSISSPQQSDSSSSISLSPIPQSKSPSKKSTIRKPVKKKKKKKKKKKRRGR